MTARSRLTSSPRTVASSEGCRFVNTTLTEVAPATTCAFVKMIPFLDSTTPEPSPDPPTSVTRTFTTEGRMWAIIRAALEAGAACVLWISATAGEFDADDDPWRDRPYARPPP